MLFERFPGSVVRSLVMVSMLAPDVLGLCMPGELYVLLSLRCSPDACLVAKQYLHAVRGSLAPSPFLPLAPQYTGTSGWMYLGVGTCFKCPALYFCPVRASVLACPGRSEGRAKRAKMPTLTPAAARPPHSPLPARPGRSSCTPRPPGPPPHQGDSNYYPCTAGYYCPPAVGGGDHGCRPNPLCG